MPRHPPCALNNEHTNHHTNKRVATQVNLTKILTKEKRNHTNTHKQTTQMQSIQCVFNARVHYTVLTQHPNHTQPTHTVSTRLMVRHTKKGNNAPDTQQCTNIQTIYFLQLCTARVSQSAIQTLGLALKGVCFTRTIFTKGWQHDTRTLNQPRMQLHPQIKAP